MKKRKLEVRGFGEIIKRYRTTLCLSTQDAAQLSGITPAGWNQIENNKREPQLTTALKIMRALHIPISDLLFVGIPKTQIVYSQEESV